MPITTMALDEMLATYSDGDEHGWPTEFAWLREHHRTQLDDLAASIQATGIREPVVVGADRRVWDGHHRLCVAEELGLQVVPVDRPPQRIQRKRTAGWRMPEGAVYVGRPSEWGNPFSAMDVGAQFPSLTDEQLAGMLIAQFRDLIRAGRIDLPNWRYAGGKRGRFVATYPSHGEIRTALAGHDLACWCPLDQPCHADVLLEVANADPS